MIERVRKLFFFFFKEMSKEETQLYIYKDPKMILRTHLMCYAVARNVSQ